VTGKICSVLSMVTPGYDFKESYRYAKCGKPREVQEFKEKEEKAVSTNSKGTSTRTDCTIGKAIDYSL